ncbi:MAG TPA: VOC family protein [Caulobacteraceae bacterium]|nr:VOC family protein [Caulobacteraceae bacterium]
MAKTETPAASPRNLMIVRYVHDMEQAFHELGLGLAPVFRSPGWSMLACGTALVGLHLIDKGVTERPVPWAGLNLEVDDLEAAVARAQACGARLVHIREPEPRVPVRLAVMVDPDGGGFELRRSVASD